jgi:methylthioribose-1-phosphate isomerase
LSSTYLSGNTKLIRNFRLPPDTLRDVQADNELCSLRWNSSGQAVEIIDQTLLPHTLQWRELITLESYCHAIAAMQVRGAPLIGITAAFGLAQETVRDPSLDNIQCAAGALLATRPTAVNLRWALDEVISAVRDLEPGMRGDAAIATACQLRAEDISHCARLGEYGLQLLRGLKPAGVLNVMTHCNAGWLATVQWGTALAPVYKAHAAGIAVHVWVSETRPRNQGMNLTAWELQRAGIPCTLIADNACGHLLRQGEVDCVMVGSDRTAANGDVCNKVGTYLKALAAQANGVPFYVMLPESTIDWRCPSGDDIPIEQRDESELLGIRGVDAGGEARVLMLAGAGSRAHNPAFDVTPAELVTALVTEHGIFEPGPPGMERLRNQISSSRPM